MEKNKQIWWWITIFRRKRMWSWGCSGTSPVCRHAHVAEYSEPSDASFAVATERPGVSPSTVSLSQSACSRGLIRHTFEGADRSVVNIVVMYMEDVRKLCFYTVYRFYGHWFWSCCLCAIPVQSWKLMKFSDFVHFVHFVPRPFLRSKSSWRMSGPHGKTDKWFAKSCCCGRFCKGPSWYHPYNFPCFFMFLHVFHVVNRFVQPFGHSHPLGQVLGEQRLQLMVAWNMPWSSQCRSGDGGDGSKPMVPYWWVPQFLAGNADKWMVIPQKCWAHRF